MLQILVVYYFAWNVFENYIHGLSCTRVYTNLPSGILAVAGFVQSSDGRHCSIVINYNPYQSLLNMSSDFLTYYPEEDDQQLEDYGSGELAVKFVVEEEMKELLGKEEEWE